MKKLILLLLIVPIVSFGQDDYQVINDFRKIFKNKNRKTYYDFPRAISDFLVSRYDIYKNGKHYLQFDYTTIDIDSTIEYAWKDTYIDGVVGKLSKNLWWVPLDTRTGRASPNIWIHSNSNNSIYEDAYVGKHTSYHIPKDNSGEHTINVNEDFELNAGMPFKFCSKYIQAKELTPPFVLYRKNYNYGNGEVVLISQIPKNNFLEIRPLIEPSQKYEITIGRENVSGKILNEKNLISYEINLIPKPNKSLYEIDPKDSWAYYTIKNRNTENIIKIKIIKKRSGIEYYNEEKTYGGDSFRDVFSNENVSRLQILREGKKIYFSINGKLIDVTENHSFINNSFLLSSGTWAWNGNFTRPFERKIFFQDLIGSTGGFEIIKPIKTKKINSEWSSSGSGFFVSTSGYIATNYHVIEDSNFIEIEHTIKGIKHTYEAEVVQTDPSNDLAILKVPNNHLKTLGKIPYYLKTRSTDVGTSVFALGYPMALNGMGKEIKFTDGKVSSKTGFNGDIRTYQTTTPIQAGNSGGPLFDYSGNLIGVNSAKISSDKADNVSYSIKSSYLNNLMDLLPESTSVPSDNSISNQTLVNKIKVLSDYVVLIKVK